MIGSEKAKREEHTMEPKNSEGALHTILDSVNPKLTRAFLPWILRHPRTLRGAHKLARSFSRCEKTRAGYNTHEELVPPVLIASITNRCNLDCAGCFASRLGHSGKKAVERSALSEEEWRRVFSQANELGIFAFLVAGGEPFLFPGLLDLCRAYGDNLFVVFTNGTALSTTHLSQLQKCHNVVVVASLEGDRARNDARRGKGTYQKVVATLEKLRENGTPSGVSVTITRDNVWYWMQEEHVDALVSLGTHLAFFTEWIPTNSTQHIPGPPEGLACLDTKNRSAFRAKILEYKESKPLFIIHSPGDEEAFGGCVSSGKGFVHVTPFGDLTPCPVANVATHNLRNDSLLDSLKSPLLKLIRDNEALLETGDGPCALFAHQEELGRLVQQVGGYRTSSER